MHNQANPCTAAQAPIQLLEIGVELVHIFNSQNTTKKREISVGLYKLEDHPPECRNPAKIQSAVVFCFQFVLWLRPKKARIFASFIDHPHNIRIQSNVIEK